MNSANIKNASKNPAVVQFAKYLVGGGVWFWSGYAAFAVCFSLFHWHWFWAKTVADITGLSFNYIVQRFWAFNSPKLKKKKQHHGRRYIIISVLTVLIDYGIVGGLERIGITPYIGLFVAAGFFTAWNYLWYRFWVFAPAASVSKSKN